MFLKTVLLVLAVSADAFAAAVGLGSAGIKVPFRSAAVISLTGTVFLGLSVFFADIISRFLPYTLCRIMAAIILAALGTVNIFYGALKKASQEAENSPEQIKLFFDSTAADKDNSKTISCREALALSVAVSVDSLAMGLGAGLGRISVIPLAAMAFLVGFLAVAGGAFIGRHVVSTRKVNLQRVCGIILIALAFFG